MRSKSAHTKIGSNAKGRRGVNPRLPFDKKERRKLSLLLAGLSVLLAAAAITVGINIWNEGDTARLNAQSLLTQYNQAVSASPAAATPGDETALPEGTPSPAASALPPEDNHVQPSQPEVDPADALISLPGYDVIGKISIEKINVELPVISKMNAKALKVSVCYYQGALPGEKGNMVITGHNYANGAHFGRLDVLKAGDVVALNAPDGQVYRYEVYETLVVKPDDTEALDKYEGEYALTLLTCTSSGNRRLIVRCRLKQGM